MTRIGLYAGTFDPVHNGHIAFALAALQQCGLDSVVFLPEPTPRGKQQVTGIAQRIAMLQLAIAEHPDLQVLALPDAQFTVSRTLPKLQQRFGRELTLLVGSDVARHIPQWEGAEDLYEAVHIVVTQRQGDMPVRLPVPITIVSAKHADVAARLVRSGKSQETAPEVREYIRENHLYSV